MDNTSKRPLMPDRSASSISDELDPYRELRARLALLVPDLKVISILSSERKDLKSRVVFHLAETYAAQGKKVVLVDGDLRSPLLSRDAGDKGRNTLNDLLKGKGSIDDGLVRINAYEALYLLPAAPEPDRSTELLESQKLALIIEELKTRFDCIIIDTLPTGEGMDAYVLSRFSDGVIYTITEGSTNAAHLIDKKKILDEAGIPVLGAVYLRS